MHPNFSQLVYMKTHVGSMVLRQHLVNLIKMCLLKLNQLRGHIRLENPWQHMAMIITKGFLKQQNH